jgi:hypothetical protein
LTIIPMFVPAPTYRLIGLLPNLFQEDDKAKRLIKAVSTPYSSAVVLKLA